ncbi:hypothetical protein GGI07_003676 [Coemansia sp. Benny D115]|nr:hypothetical protein GGI07_003676 [Coemansia sp. Benny D115]
MSTQKSFLDNFSLDSSWISGNQLSIQSPGNSQNDTLSDESRKLHQDHKSIKRAVDRTAQESAVAFSSLHEKTSKLNLSISDLHSDLKKLERSVMIENDSLRTSSVDMEIKLNNIGK